MFEYKTTIKLHETDAAGLLFFANQFRLVHDAYEAFMESRDMGLGKLLTSKPFLLPIVHAETDYKAPLRVGDVIMITIRVKRKGTSSFTLAHELHKNDTLAGSGETVHACLDTKTGKPIPLPNPLSDILG
ncbi:MAG: acyl-CoA thioesterase [bacterium]|nr:acyl-CoA thioesterase [bacterium]